MRAFHFPTPLLDAIMVEAAAAKLLGQTCAASPSTRHASTATAVDSSTSPHSPCLAGTEGDMST